MPFNRIPEPAQSYNNQSGIMAGVDGVNTAITDSCIAYWAEMKRTGQINENLYDAIVTPLKLISENLVVINTNIGSKLTDVGGG